MLQGVKDPGMVAVKDLHGGVRNMACVAFPASRE